MPFMHICKSEKYWGNNLKTANRERKRGFGVKPPKMFLLTMPFRLWKA